MEAPAIKVLEGHEGLWVEHGIERDSSDDSKRKEESCRAGLPLLRESVNKQGQKVGGNVNIKGHLMSSRWK